LKARLLSERAEVLILSSCVGVSQSTCASKHNTCSRT
jgi:hypothetical protein